MAEKKPAKKGTKRSAGTGSTGLTAEERAALKETVRERKAGGANDEGALLAKVAAMSEPDRSVAKRIHAIVTSTAPDLSPKTWYGMPAWANKAGKVVCFFQDRAKFKSKYATLGFSHDNANLDDGNMWPNAYSLKKLTPAEEARIAALVRKAVS